VKKAAKLFGPAGFDQESVLAKAFDVNLTQIENIDRLIANVEARHNSALREIDRWHQTFKGAIQKAIEDAEDAEFSEVQAPGPGLFAPVNYPRQSTNSRALYFSRY
jgi:hypothetical protein